MTTKRPSYEEVISIFSTIIIMADTMLLTNLRSDGYLSKNKQKVCILLLFGLNDFSMMDLHDERCCAAAASLIAAPVLCLKHRRLDRRVAGALSIQYTASKSSCCCCMLHGHSQCWWFAFWIHAKDWFLLLVYDVDGSLVSAAVLKYLLIWIAQKGFHARLRLFGHLLQFPLVGSLEYRTVLVRYSHSPQQASALPHLLLRPTPSSLKLLTCFCSIKNVCHNTTITAFIIVVISTTSFTLSFLASRGVYFDFDVCRLHAIGLSIDWKAA